MKAFVIGLFALGLTTVAHAKQQGEGNANNEKMCVCEPCGGKLVPCKDTKEEYIKPVQPLNIKPGNAQSAQDKPAE